MLENDLTIKYARIRLDKTNYKILDNFSLLESYNLIELKNIFKDYCQHKQFLSVEPMWDAEFTWDHNDVLGYYDDNKLVAWSVVTKYSHDDVYNVQFAWNYANPNLRLGIKSIQSECAYYKSLGYKYYYLGEAHKYKSEIDGFEILGSL